MVAIHPFRALRYSPDVIGELSRVLAPPYDVIEAEEQEQLYQASSYNIVRLILGKQYPTDTSEDNRYTRAARDFAAWRERQILRADPAPSLYLMEHTFDDDGGYSRARLGFIALLELGDPIERLIYRHEETLAAPTEDRTKLFEAVPANLSPIFCVYPDPGKAVQTLLEAAARRAPPTAQAAIHGERIRLWALTDPHVIQEIAQRLASVAVLIADGHHRFEVAYAKRRRYGRLMSYFVSMEDPALVVRPIQRVVQHTERADLPQALQGLCAIERSADLSSLMRWLKEDDGQGRFGAYDGHALYRMTLDPAHLARWLMSPSVRLPLATLDVSLLHGLILPSLGVSPSGANPATREHRGEDSGTGVRYTADATRALQMVDQGEGSSAWLLRGISLQQVYALAAQGISLPPKSTYFYPKVPSGLTINPLG